MVTSSVNMTSEGRYSHGLRGRWGWLLGLGIVQIVTGVIALEIPAAASLASSLLFGVLLLVSAGAQLVHAIQVRGWKGFSFHALGAVLYGVAGAFILYNPLLGLVALTSLLVALFLTAGLVRIVLAIRLRAGDGWSWFLASGLVSVLLGALLLFHWPASALWAVGTLLGINLLFAGVSHALLATMSRLS